MVQLSIKGFLSKFKILWFFHIRHDPHFRISHVEWLVIQDMVTVKVSTFQIYFYDI